MSHAGKEGVVVTSDMEDLVLFGMSWFRYCCTYFQAAKSMLLRATSCPRCHEMFLVFLRTQAKPRRSTRPERLEAVY